MVVVPVPVVLRLLARDEGKSKRKYECIVSATN
jgi:hypothetical protein